MEEEPSIVHVIVAEECGGEWFRGAVILVTACSGGLAHCMLGYPPSFQQTPWADTPRQTHPQADTPGQTSPAQCMLAYGQQAGGTHPTGMHSC